MRRSDGNLQPLARPYTFDGRKIDRQRIAFINDAWVITELFGRAIVIEEAVVFPFNIVKLGKYVARNLRVPAKFVGQELEAPTDVAISIESPNAAVFAVDEGLRLL